MAAEMIALSKCKLSPLFATTALPTLKLPHGLMRPRPIKEASPKLTLTVADAEDRVVEERAFASEGFDHDAATREIVETGRALIRGGSVAAFGHRVVHGGLDYDSPVRVTEAVLNDLMKLSPLAPLHQPHNLAPIRTILNVAPQIAQVACFDTAFHRSQSHLAQAFALPRRFADAGVRRYGFHGLSYEFLVSRLRELAPELASARVVFAHLGNGASLCAVRDGRSVATTMGFTAVDGLMMGTRSGAVDPGVILFMMQELGMDSAEIEDVIYRQSGLLGVSGISSDMRALRDSSDPAAAEAIALFVYRIMRELGSLVAALGGLDALVLDTELGELEMVLRRVNDDESLGLFDLTVERLLPVGAGRDAAILIKVEKRGHTQARALGKAIFPVIEAPAKGSPISLGIQKLDLTRDREGGLKRLLPELVQVALNAQAASRGTRLARLFPVCSRSRKRTPRSISAATTTSAV